MNTELVTLYSRVIAPEPRERGVGQPLVARFNTEVASLGYTLERKLFARLVAADFLDFYAFRGEMLELLGELSGATAKHRTLFRKFPYEVPDDLSYLENWVLAYVRQNLGLNPSSLGRLRLDENGLVIDIEMAGDAVGDPDDDDARVPFAFNQELIGDGLHDDVEIVHAFKRITPLKPLFLADRAFLVSKAGALLGRNSSLSGDEKKLLTGIPRDIGAEALAALLDGGWKPFREQIPLAYSFASDMDAFSRSLAGATDVLRIAAFLSDPEADLSLKQPVKFKLAKRHKRNLLRLLDGRSNLEEDLMRHRERWLRFGEIVNPQTAANEKRHPRLAAAFDTLRNRPKSIETFGRVIERKLRSREIDSDLLTTLAKRPGEFGRRLDLLLRTSRNPTDVLEALRGAATGMTTAALLALRKHLQHRASSTGQDRVFLPKGASNRMQIAQDRRETIAPDVLTEAADVITADLRRRFADLPAMGKVWLDPCLKDVLLPYNRRGDSSTNVAFPKGSRWPMSNADVFRLFVHWTGRDVDLSILLADSDMTIREHVAYTQLAAYKCKHSGDVREAPNGASEFIDFDVPDLREHGIRYVISSVISFSGEAFRTFPCFAGFMERDALTSGRKFEPEAVLLKFHVTADSTAVMPLVFDLEDRKVVFADIVSGNRSGGAVIRSGTANKFKMQALAVLDLVNRKPTAWDVLVEHVSARGRLVTNPEDADTAISVANLDLEWVCSLTA